jgi:hypothetical protein
MKVSQSVSHERMQHHTQVRNMFEFATVGGRTFQHLFTQQVDCTCVGDVCLNWLNMLTVLQSA